MKLQNYFWLLPFSSFCLGYLLLYFLLSAPTLEVPSLIGNNITNAVKMLCHANLNLRIITQKEDNDLPDGTIISQNPRSGHTIKPNQAIYCVISCKSQTKSAPNLVNQTTEQIAEVAKKEGIRLKKIFLESKYPSGVCIGQIPKAGHPLEHKNLLVYISVPNDTKVLFPDLQGRLVPEVLEFLKPYGLSPTIFHRSSLETGHHCINCRVINQKPLPGSIVDLSKHLNIQLQVR